MSDHQCSQRDADIPMVVNENIKVCGEQPRGSPEKDAGDGTFQSGFVIKAAPIHHHGETEAWTTIDPPRQNSPEQCDQESQSSDRTVHSDQQLLICGNPLPNKTVHRSPKRRRLPTPPDSQPTSFVRPNSPFEALEPEVSVLLLQSFIVH